MKIKRIMVLSAVMSIAIVATAADFDDQRTARKAKVKTEDAKADEDGKSSEKPEKAAESVRDEEAGSSPEAGLGKKNLHPALGEDEAFDELLKDIRGGNAEHVESLLSVFPKLLDRQDKFGQTPLFNAVSANQYAIVELLLKMNADVRLPNANGDTPLHKAAQSGDLKTLELLLKKGGTLIWKGNAKGETPFMKAASAGQGETVKFLLKNNADVNGKDAKGDTPLHRAAAKGDTGMLKLLLENGADASVRNKENMKPADLAKTPEIKEMIEATSKR